ncbi:platelet glycoprotein Ib alpha chain isoform X3 [Hippoglossus stenolepis]|uniref:platelet glycoprotein Ib alpha chain isoform X3 n=1 Tax=Hippoglossus stenolepis TaxID=195615 RepID=UPI001FAEDFC2|nr:platelet glycoprotein Ib alpha chain isoform X3 [Hippoglossus stenolepis]
MTSALMARVWLVFILAQHNNAERHRCARGRSTDQDEFHGGSVRQFRSVTDDLKDRRPPTLVRNFLTEFLTNKGGAIKQWKTSSTFMDISKLPDGDSGHELAYVDATGRLCPKLAACYPTLSKNVLRHHVRRAPQETDFFNMWSIDEIPVDPYDPDTTTSPPPPPQTPPPQTTPQTTVDPVTEDIDYVFNEFWGLPEIPDEPYIGVDIVIPVLTTTLAPATTTTAPATTTTLAPATTTTAPATTTTPTPTTTTTLAPLTTTNAATTTPDGPTTGTL